MVELCLVREFRIQHPRTLAAFRSRALFSGAFGPGDHFGQAVIGLRAKYNVQEWCPGQHLGRLRLGHTAGDGKQRAAVFRIILCPLLLYLA